MSWGYKPRKAIGEAKRQNQQHEAARAVEFERLLNLHGLDYWHCTVAMRSQPGFPDYAIFGDGWHAFCELKARNPENNRKGRLSPGQERYKAAIEASGAEYRWFLLPDDWDAVDEWLNDHTGKDIWQSPRRMP